MRLLSLGHGYVAEALVRALPAGTEVRATTRRPERMAQMQGVTPLLLPDTDLAPHVAWATHVLVSAAPEGGIDPFWLAIAEDIIDHQPAWLGYLSSTGVYGDRQGAWVDETASVSPIGNRAGDRIKAERSWVDVVRATHIFRISGIYGPGRAPFAGLRAGTQRRIIREGQVFSRIHVDDIAQVLRASMLAPAPGVYNLADDLPAPNADVVAYAAEIAGLPLPPAEDFETAALSPMARGFFMESRRVCNRKIKEDLGITLRYPNYRVGLQAILAAGA
ncbi:NAD-dependent epimerase/dehydratase [Ketogulonicigenium robustum]|uniref:NAD-dependent epimerase/dehydratase n=1 Tax=Ketogulonicigenium robustum TaxID=92947 RepID=A0A1W6P2M9_9RHOB|nr:SDR family oxidoreductase [Ketogulonicigenium robustum]ARO15736.1 NAD-dependent epimerase/dehydratase [Ketogulonicigenium robustum]